MSIKKNFNEIEAFEKNILNYIDSLKPNSKIAITYNFALNKNFEAAISPIQEGSFGYFNLYTASIIDKIFVKAKEKNLDLGIALLVDDHHNMADHLWYQELNFREVNPQINGIANGVDNFFNQLNLANLVNSIFDNVNEKDIIRSLTFGKPFFQESKYRILFGDNYPTEEIGCAGEVNLFYQDLGKQGYTNIISFFPERCTKPTCNAAGRYDLEAKTNEELVNQNRVHIYLPTERKYGGVLVDSLEKFENLLQNNNGINVIKRL